MTSIKGPQKCNIAKATIKENDDYFIVEYDNDSKFLKREPTLKNPEILVDLGFKAEFQKVYYPKSKYKKSQIKALTRKRLNMTEKCPMCERTETSILEKHLVEDQPDPEIKDIDDDDYDSLKEWGIKKRKV